MASVVGRPPAQGAVPASTTVQQPTVPMQPGTMSSLGFGSGTAVIPAQSQQIPILGSVFGGVKPVPMKLFATWEVDRTPPNCIPRLCTLTLTRLVLYKSLGSDLGSVVIAVKMQSSKRTLRSNEIVLPTSGLLDTELELTFSLQYPHFLKRDGNQLQIMLQRRKKYKNRTILGFKTLAIGTINMSQVLQKQLDLELELFTDQKEKSGSALGKIYMLALSSQPVDHEDPANRSKGEQEELGDTDEDDDYGSSVDEGSDSEPMLDEPLHRRRMKSRPVKSGTAAARQRNLKQKFVALLKKFKVTDPEDLDREPSLDRKLSEGVDPAEIADLFDQLEDLSDSGQELDNLSIGSTPKPSLKPFFCSSRNLLQEARTAMANESAQAAAYGLLHQPSSDHGGIGSDRLSDASSKEGISDSHPETLTDPEYSDPPVVTSSPPQSGDEVKSKEKALSGDRRSRLFSSSKGERSTTSAFALKQQKIGGASQNKDRLERLASSQSTFDASSPRKVLLEQLSRVLPNDVDSLPDQVILANTCDRQGAHLAGKLTDRGHRVVCTAGPADVRASLTCLVAKIQKFCNTKTESPPLVRVVLIGSDTFVNSVLRPYVELFSSKPPDWQGYVKFFIIPLGLNTVSKYMATQDPRYSSLFHHDSWRELLEKPEPAKTDVAELVARIGQYLACPIESLMHLPIAEAMVTYKEKSSDEESSQVFIPFLSEVRVGSLGCDQLISVDMEDALPTTIGSPPTTSALANQQNLDRRPDKLTPPSSPHVTGTKDRSEFLFDPIDLQLDYWVTEQKSRASTSGIEKDPISGRGDSKRAGTEMTTNKYSVKTSIRFMQVQRQQLVDAFSMQYWLKEKKPKTVMRLGKKKEKEKESEMRNQSVEGITRLICLSKGQHPLKVTIDGLDWSAVKFFQLSSQWQTHIKYFPVASFVTSSASQQTAL